MKRNLTIVFLGILLLSCSGDQIDEFSIPLSERLIRSIQVEKPEEGPQSGFIMEFDAYSRPLSYRSSSSNTAYRTFEFSEEKLLEITFNSEEAFSYQFSYDDQRLSQQYAVIDTDEISQLFYYEGSTVQVVRFDNEVFFSTSFFFFSDEKREQLTEILSYDNGGILRSQFLFEYDGEDNILQQEHYIYDVLQDEMILNERIQQTYDSAINPLSNNKNPGWMEAWFLALYESDSFIENISRLAQNNVLTRTSINRFGIQSETRFDYQYDAFGYPLSATGTTDGEFNVKNFTYSYYN